MAQRPPKLPGYSWLSPYLTVRDSQQAIDFYQRAFGCQPKEAVKGPDGKVLHFEVTWKDVVIMGGPEGTKPGCPERCPTTSGVPSPVGLYLYCEDVDAQFQRATAAGAEVVMPPTDMFYGDRVATLRDPDGYQWHFATNRADFDPAKMPKG